MKEIKDIVKEYLETIGYDGLVSDLCGCEVSDLMPCGEPRPDCQAGWKISGCSPECGEGCDFHISSLHPDKSGDAE